MYGERPPFAVWCAGGLSPDYADRNKTFLRPWQGVALATRKQPDVTHEASAAEKRVRFVAARADRQPGSRVRVGVEVSFEDRSHEAEAEGIGTETIEIRLASLATLEAIREVTGTPPFRLVGVKLMHAFDAEVILVALRDPEIEGTRYIGAVPVRTTHVAAAAAAVMDATNRVLFRRGDPGAD